MSTDIEARLEAAFRAAADVIGEPEATEPRPDSRPVPARRDRGGRWLTGWAVPLAVAAAVLLVLAGSIALINDVRSGRPAHQPTSSPTPTTLSTPTSSPAPTSSPTPTASGTGSPTTTPLLTGPPAALAQLLPSGAGYVRTDTAVLLTADYGASWANVTPSGLAAQLGSAAVSFRPDGTLFIAAPAPDGQLVTVYRRAPGSRAWSRSTVPVAERQVPAGIGQTLSLSFSDADHGWLAVCSILGHSGTGVLLRTEDGGASWVQAAAAVPDAGVVTAVSSVDGFFTAPMNGWTFVSHDAGASWARFTLAAPASKHGDTVRLLGQPAVSGSVVLVAAQFSTADVGNPDGIGLYRSDDHGLSWTLTRTVAMQADESDVFAMQPDGSYALLRSLLPTPGASRTWTVSISSDGGRTFRDAPSTLQVGDPETLWSAGGGRLWVLTSDDGCQHGKSGCSATTGILATSDDGAHWRQLDLPG